MHDAVLLNIQMTTNFIRTLMDEDAIQWRKFAKGSEKAFDYLYEKFFFILYDYALRFCKDEALIKDCIQELFIELWEKRTSLNTVLSVRSYLYVALRRKLVRHLSEQNKFVNSSSSHDFNIELSHEALLAQKELQEETQAKLDQLFNALTPRQKEAIYLKFYENLAYQEIATIMSFSDPRYARQLIYRTLDELRHILHESKSNIKLPIALLLLLLFLLP